MNALTEAGDPQEPSRAGVPARATYQWHTSVADNRLQMVWRAQGHADTSDNDPLQALGAAISELRAERDMSVNELATATGITPERLERLEAGHLDPPFDLICALALGLAVRPSTIVARAQQRQEADS